MFGFWDWVGGRYSMDSAIGLSTMLAIGGEDGFTEMLEGFHALDEHFRTAPFQQNLPVILGLLAVWYGDFFGCPELWSDALRAVPQAFSGLSATVDDGIQRQARHAGRGEGHYQTGGIYGQNPEPTVTSFYQLIDQGTGMIPLDLIGFGENPNPLGDHHVFLMSNVFAQAEALAFGKTEAEVRAEGTARAAPSEVTEGNRPTTVLFAEKLTPQTLGTLVALYEHSVFTEGVMWEIDSSDHGVWSFGKVRATGIIPELRAHRAQALS